MSINWLGLVQPQDETLPAQPGGCARCHVGLGDRPNDVNHLTDQDYSNIDCLVCHGQGYKRTVVKDEATGSFVLAPSPDIDVVAIAQKAGRPTDDACLSCHLKSGGGPNFKHGEVLTSGTDVHQGAGLKCIDCHITQQHEIAGGADNKAQELTDLPLRCSNCHTERPHRWEDAAYNAHSARIACQTCHIPLLARDESLPTQVSRDWSQPRFIESTGLYAPSMEFASRYEPDYFWWNRQVSIPPAPVGSRDDDGAKITPWKTVTVKAPVDASDGHGLPIKIGLFYITGDLDAAVNKGIDLTGVDYSGEWQLGEETIHFSMNHQVAPSSEALTCVDCHTSEGGRLDYAALGYDAERAAALGSDEPIRLLEVARSLEVKESETDPLKLWVGSSDEAPPPGVVTEAPTGSGGFMVGGLLGSLLGLAVGGVIFAICMRNQMRNGSGPKAEEGGHEAG